MNGRRYVPLATLKTLAELCKFNLSEIKNDITRVRLLNVRNTHSIPFDNAGDNNDLIGT